MAVKKKRSSINLIGTNLKGNKFRADVNLEEATPTKVEMKTPEEIGTQVVALKCIKSCVAMDLLISIQEDNR